MHSCIVCFFGYFDIKRVTEKEKTEEKGKKGENRKEEYKKTKEPNKINKNKTRTEDFFPPIRSASSLGGTTPAYFLARG